MDGWMGGVLEIRCVLNIYKKFTSMLWKTVLQTLFSPYQSCPPQSAGVHLLCQGQILKSPYALQYSMFWCSSDSARCLKLVQLPKTTRKNSLRKVICIMTPWHGPPFFFFILSSDVMIEGSSVQVMFAVGCPDLTANKSCCVKQRRALPQI